jgi:hypothetical protein
MTRDFENPYKTKEDYRKHYEEIFKIKPFDNISKYIDRLECDVVSMRLTINDQAVTIWGLKDTIEAQAKRIEELKLEYCKDIECSNVNNRNSCQCKWKQGE